MCIRDSAWGFQLVHHDLWDYDTAAPPLLATLTHAGKPTPVVIQGNKTGLLYVLHRDTGAPVFPVEERPVPQSDIPGEVTSPTQPFPVAPPPLVPQQLSADSVWGPTPEDREWCRMEIGRLRNQGIFLSLIHIFHHRRRVHLSSSVPRQRLVPVVHQLPVPVRRALLGHLPFRYRAYSVDGFPDGHAEFLSPQLPAFRVHILDSEHAQDHPAGELCGARALLRRHLERCVSEGRRIPHVVARSLDAVCLRGFGVLGRVSKNASESGLAN